MKSKLKLAVLMDVSRAYDRDLLAGITNYNKLHDKFNFFFYSPKYIQGKSDTNLVQRIVSWGPDGILTREIEELQSLIELEIPMLISPYKLPYPGLVNIWGDNTNMGETAANYFVAKGFKNYAFFGFREFQWSVERQKGFETLISQKGFNISNFIFDSADLLWEDLPSRLVEWLSTLKKPCAIFSATDELNIHLLEAVRATNVKVPDDVSILGVDNDTMICEMGSPTLSSIDQNAVRVGFDAAQALHNWIENGQRPTNNIAASSVNVVSRNSTNALAIEDEQMRVAMHYIAATAAVEDITVEDVVRTTHLSRRILEKRFQSTIKSSILEEIKKVRIERIKYLLENSELSLKQIAFELNFNNFDNITRYFKQYTDLTPLEYRNRNRKIS